MARIIGQKRAREIWFLCRFYSADEALSWGLVNAVVPVARLERETLKWCRRMLQNSPTALQCLKAALNADPAATGGCASASTGPSRRSPGSEWCMHGDLAWCHERSPRAFCTPCFWRSCAARGCPERNNFCAGAHNSIIGTLVDNSAIVGAIPQRRSGRPASSRTDPTSPPTGRCLTTRSR